MIEKINRKTILEKHNNIADQISGIQNAFYDEDDLNFAESEKEKEEYLSSFDALDFNIESSISFNKIISLDHSELDTFPKNLAQKLISLLSELGVETLYVISHLKMNFFGNLEIKHKQLIASYKTLEKIVGNNHYEEAFKIDLEDLTNLISIIFWMQRIDGSSPEFIFFYDEKDRLAFYLCKYGKVHTIEFEREILGPEILSKYGWENIDECSDSFSKNNKIIGRLFKM
jgi:hypothetical protein